jgi:hypothetical protein
MNSTELLKKHGLPHVGVGEVGDGWALIVEELITGLKAVGWDGDLQQIKEKFGGLRFYVGNATSEMHSLIDAAEQKSLKTCEVCGSPGETRDRLWIKTLCDTHVKA